MSLGCAVLLTQSAPLTGTATILGLHVGLPAADAIRTPYGDSNTIVTLLDKPSRDATRTPYGDGNLDFTFTHFRDATRTPYGDGNSASNLSITICTANAIHTPLRGR